VYIYALPQNKKRTNVDTQYPVSMLSIWFQQQSLWKIMTCWRPLLLLTNSKRQSSPCKQTSVLDWMVSIWVFTNILGHICGQEVYQAGSQWLANNVFSPLANSTYIMLIPKGDTNVSMKDWRFIVLCNVVYKIVAKVLANRLKQVLDMRISINQLTFVLGR